MLTWSLAFFVLAMIAAVFGFGGTATGAAETAQILFLLFLAIFAISMIGWLLTDKRPDPPSV